MSLKKRRMSAYQIGRELGIHPPNVYRSIKTSQKKLRKLLKDLKDLDIQPNQLEQFLEELQEEPEEQEAPLRLIT